MSDVFKGQELLTIKLDCVTDIGSATVLKILFKKPDGSVGEWVAQRDGATNKIYYTVSSGEIDQVGKWKLQSFVTIGGNDGLGDVVEVDFKQPLK